MKNEKKKTELSDDIKVCLDNISRLDGKQASLFASRNALIRELAFSICDGNPSPEKLRQNYASAFNAAESAYDTAQRYFGGAATVDRANVCAAIAELMDKSNPFLRAVLGQGESCPKKALGKISYVKNNYTDSAYLVFAKQVHEPKVSYSDSFETICEDVFNGESEFCILPVETSSEGRLFAFYSLIDRYDLKTCSVCSVDRDGGAAFTKFALLRRSFSDSNINNIIKNNGARLELRISPPTSPDDSINSILVAADACGMPLLRVDSLPLPYGDSLLSHYAVFEVKQDAICGFLTFVALEFPQCYVSGLYLAGNNQNTNNKLKGYIN